MSCESFRLTVFDALIRFKNLCKWKIRNHLVTSFSENRNFIAICKLENMECMAHCICCTVCCRIFMYGSYNQKLRNETALSEVEFRYTKAYVCRISGLQIRMEGLFLRTKFLH